MDILRLIDVCKIDTTPLITHRYKLADIYLDYAPDGTLLRTAVDVEDYDNIYYYLP